MPSGMLPERATPGRRRIVTLLFSHLTPAQLHGEVCLMFQRNVRPPTAERRVRRAVLSALRSWVDGRGRERRRNERKMERIVMDELGKTRIVTIQKRRREEEDGEERETLKMKTLSCNYRKRSESSQQPNPLLLLFPMLFLS